MGVRTGLDGAAGAVVAGGVGLVVALMVPGAVALLVTGLCVLGFFLAGLRVR